MRNRNKCLALLNTAILLLVVNAGAAFANAENAEAHRSANAPNSPTGGNASGNDGGAIEAGNPLCGTHPH